MLVAKENLEALVGHLPNSHTSHTDEVTIGFSRLAWRAHTAVPSVDHPAPALPVVRTQILVQDDVIPHLTRRFEAAAVLMALQWY